MPIAITRQVSRRFNECELTHLTREPIDVALARQQHHAYENILGELGCQVLQLPEEPDLPDSVFVEDTAIVFDEIAILTHPGAESRRPEVDSVAAALKPYRQLSAIQSPATLDGGDVLRLGRKVYIGETTRSDPQAITQVRRILEPLGYTVQGVPVEQCLHLKSAVTQVGPDLLLLNPEMVDPAVFSTWRWLAVNPDEPLAANALWLSGKVVFPAGHAATLGRLKEAGVPVIPVEVSEISKAEGGVTCCSLILNS